MNALLELCTIPADTREGGRSPVVQSRGLFHSAVDTFCLGRAIPRVSKELKSDVILCRSAGWRTYALWNRWVSNQNRADM